MNAKKLERITLPAERVRELLEHAKAVLAEEDYQVLENLVQSFAYVTELLEEEGMTVRRLRKLLFGFKSEKLRRVLVNLNAAPQGQEGTAAASEATTVPEGDGGGAPGAPGNGSALGGENDSQRAGAEKKKRKGHGRNGADAYAGAERILIQHPSLKPGDPCPLKGCEGKVYTFVPQKLVVIIGQAPVGATVTEIEQLRCNLCLKVFPAAPVEASESGKYDPTAASMIALLRYGTGVPFNRLEGLEKNLGIPLPASTQWDVVNRAVKEIAPAYAALIEEAAQGDVFYNDDTPMKILSLMRKRKEGKADDG
jgi:hypothetical protein